VAGSAGLSLWGGFAAGGGFAVRGGGFAAGGTSLMLAGRLAS